MNQVKVLAVTLTTMMVALTRKLFGLRNTAHSDMCGSASYFIAVIYIIFLSACENSAPASAASNVLVSGETPASAMSVTIQAEPSGGAILLTSILRNDSNEALVFLPWGTPFESVVTADFLTIRESNGALVVPYVGIMVKRRPPNDVDYATLMAGDSLEQVIDISKSYDFCANTEYQIAYSQTLTSLDAHLYPVQSSTVSIVTSGDFKTC